jgi:hypothetical protein
MTRSTPATNENSSPRHRTAMTPEQVRALERQKYWQSSIFELEESSASLIDDQAVRIVGQQVGLALDYAMAVTKGMMLHPDPELRWTHDTVLFHRGRVQAIIQVCPSGPAIIRFDPEALASTADAGPGRQNSRRFRVELVDGSLESASYGLGIPLAGRDLMSVLDDSIKSILESMQHPDQDYRQTEDVALAFRGRILAVIRVTGSGPVVTRFDLAGLPDVAATDGAPE